jgi:hypothetical protein
MTACKGLGQVWETSSEVCLTLQPQNAYRTWICALKGFVNVLLQEICPVNELTTIYGTFVLGEVSHGFQRETETDKSEMVVVRRQEQK